MSMKAVSTPPTKVALWKSLTSHADRQMYEETLQLPSLSCRLSDLKISATISGDSLVLRGRPGPQGQPPKER